MDAQPIIPDRAEFVDVLRLMRRGLVLVHGSDGTGGCLIDGSVVYHSFEPLSRYGLIDQIPVNPRDTRARHYRLTPRGRDFADRACAHWKRQPLLKRLAVRLAG